MRTIFGAAASLSLGIIKSPKKGFFFQAFGKTQGKPDVHFMFFQCYSENFSFLKLRINGYSIYGVFETPSGEATPA